MAETKINANQTNITASDLGAIQNTATGTNSLTILGTPCTANGGVNIGSYSQATTGGVSVGPGASATGMSSIAIGDYAVASGAGAIQLGGGFTNSDLGTLKVALWDGYYMNNFLLLDYYGVIPSERLKLAINKYSSMPTASGVKEGWIVQYTGTTDANYTHGYIYECKAQGTTPETYAWEAVEVQASSGGGNYLPISGGTMEGQVIDWGYDSAGTHTSFSGVAYHLTKGNSGYDAPKIFHYAYNTTLSWFFATANFADDYTLFNAQSNNYGSYVALQEFLNGGGYTVSFNAKPRNGGTAELGWYDKIWDRTYTKKINNGSDITVPAVAGTMAVMNNATATLAVVDWSSSTQTVNVTGVTASNTVIVAPDPASQADYTDAGIKCTAQGAGTLTFTCDTTPSSAITVNVVILG